MKDRIDEHIEFHEANDKHKSDVAFLKEVKMHINKLEESKMDKQEFNKGHLPEGVDRCHIILTMIEELLVSHPAVKEMGATSDIEMAAQFIFNAYQKIGGYTDE